jgi:uncharacterized repeat protein (TIGR03803 family)
MKTQSSCWTTVLVLVLVSNLGAQTWPCRAIKKFGASPASLIRPSSALIEGQNGALYGTTQAGGGEDAGAVYTINRDGTGFAVLHDFQAATEGQMPDSLTSGSDGLLYGVTTAGGTNGSGVLYRMNKDGSAFRVLRHLKHAQDGSSPVGGVIEGRDGLLYGVAQYGGTGGGGTVFRLNRDGSGFQVLKHFQTFAGEANYPQARLVEAGDGLLYGTTYWGGVNDSGTVFQINKDGTGYQVLKHFGSASNDGTYPQAPLVEGPGGALYGTTSSGGLNYGGTVFKLNPNGTGFTILLNLGGDLGESCVTPLVPGSNGVLYGTSGSDYYPNGFLFAVQADGGGVTNLASLGAVGAAHLLVGGDGRFYLASAAGGGTGGGAVFSLDNAGFRTDLKSFRDDGAKPKAAVVEGRDGWLYGTTYAGGFSNVGTVYRLRKDGTGYQMLHSFAATRNDDGGYPTAALLEGGDGMLYGVTGGHVISPPPSGVSYSTYPGTLFRLNKDGSGYALLRVFTNASEGVRPEAALCEGRDGWLYGTTSGGGTNYGSGVVFKVGRDGTGYQVLRHLGADGGDSAAPRAALIQASDGAFYGTSSRGGSSSAGTLFKIQADGSGYTILLTFNSANGEYPVASLLEASDGLLYGATRRGGTYGIGTLFRIGKDGTGHTVLRNCSGSSNGKYPEAALIEGPDGTLYGTMYDVVQGSLPGGVFKMGRDGTGYVLLAGFSTSTGVNPMGPVILGSDGNLYGTASDLSLTSYYGSVFRLVPPTSLLPSLTVTRTGGGVTLAWRTNNAVGFSPQYAGQIGAAPAWTNLAATILTQGGTNQVTISPGASAQFYRLKK